MILAAWLKSEGDPFSKVTCKRRSQKLPPRNRTNCVILIHKQLAGDLDEYKLVCKSQSWFGRKHSTMNYACKKVGSRVIIMGRIRGFIIKRDIYTCLKHNSSSIIITWSNLLQQDQDGPQHRQHGSALIITCCMHFSEATDFLFLTKFITS